MKPPQIWVQLGVKTSQNRPLQKTEEEVKAKEKCCEQKFFRATKKSSLFSAPAKKHCFTDTSKNHSHKFQKRIRKKTFVNSTEKKATQKQDECFPESRRLMTVATNTRKATFSEVRYYKILEFLHVN